MPHFDEEQRHTAPDGEVHESENPTYPSEEAANPKVANERPYEGGPVAAAALFIMRTAVASGLRDDAQDKLIQSMANELRILQRVFMKVAAREGDDMDQHAAYIAACDYWLRQKAGSKPAGVDLTADLADMEAEEYALDE